MKAYRRDIVDRETRQSACAVLERRAITRQSDIDLTIERCRSSTDAVEQTAPTASPLRRPRQLIPFINSNDGRRRPGIFPRRFPKLPKRLAKISARGLADDLQSPQDCPTRSNGIYVQRYLVEDKKKR